MAQGLENKYYVRKATSGEWEDLTAKFVGLKVLKLDGMNEQGDAVNVYSEQWINSQAEDFLVTTQDGQGHDVVIRKNVDLQLTFIVGTRYGALDTQTSHDAFVEYATKQGDFYIKSKYTGKEAHVVCLKGYKPTMQKLHRGALNSFIMGTIELHTLDMPQESSPEPVLGNLYIGWGGSTISDPTTLINVQHFNTNNPVGSYQIVCPTLQELPYLWICFNGVIGGVTANGFEVPMNTFVSIGDYRCYRTTNNIKPHTMTFNIE
jgi:hypothetical protein